MADAKTPSEGPGGTPDPVRYDRWFRTKVREAVTSGRPRIPHDEAMERVSALLSEKRNARCKPQ